MDSSRTLRLRLPGRPAPDDVGRLCARLAAAEPADVVCVVDARGPAGLAVVDALARIRLAADRHGHRMRVEGVGPELRALLAFTGLDAVLDGVLDGAPDGVTDVVDDNQGTGVERPYPA
ncbi:STAS domain-containing protein [Streptomyces sp. NPDC012769]|uniref:STAS domain-containing protein n=1 Tax=Streptomyces sp. NPDC012769 TaxID=3364848 RepID=UPI00367D8167